MSHYIAEMYMYAYILGVHPYDKATFDYCYSHLRVMDGIRVVECGSPALMALHMGNVEALDHFLSKGNILYAYDNRFSYLSHKHVLVLIQLRNRWFKSLLPTLVDIVMQYAEWSEIIHSSLFGQLKAAGMWTR